MLTIKLRKLLTATLLSASMGIAYASGVPTIDAAALGQLVLEFERLGEQLKTQMENLKQVTETKDNFLGQIAYYKDLIDNIQFRKTADGYIPVNANEVLSIIKDGMKSENPEIAKTIDSIMASSPALKELKADDLKKALEKSRREMAYYQAAYQEAYTAAGKRQEMAHELGKKSAEVSNEKEARALSLAMQSEELVATNELARLIAMEQMKKEREEIKERNEEELDKLIIQKRKDYFKSKIGIK